MTPWRLLLEAQAASDRLDALLRGALAPLAANLSDGDSGLRPARLPPPAPGAGASPLWAPEAHRGVGGLEGGEGALESLVRALWTSFGALRPGNQQQWRISWRGRREPGTGVAWAIHNLNAALGRGVERGRHAARSRREAAGMTKKTTTATSACVCSRTASLGQDWTTWHWRAGPIGKTVNSRACTTGASLTNFLSLLHAAHNDGVVLRSPLRALFRVHRLGPATTR